MTIDIINYTAEQVEALSKAQHARVVKAQLRKNRLERGFQEDIKKERDQMIDNGVLNSAIYALEEERFRAAFEEEIEAIREDLLIYLAASEDTAEDDHADALYYVNYDLPYENRFNTVRNYYMTIYDDPTERLEAFKKDEVAMRYLGEYYAALYDYFLALTK